MNPWNKGSVKVDHQLRATDRLSFLYLKGQYENQFGADGPTGLPIPFNGSSVNVFKSTSLRGTWDHTISPRIINTFRVAYQKESQWLATANSINPRRQVERQAEDSEHARSRSGAARADVHHVQRMERLLVGRRRRGAISISRTTSRSSAAAM